jgi:hypothetical protein
MVGFEPGDGAVGMSAVGTVRRGGVGSAAAIFGQPVGMGAIGTPARGPDSVLKALERRGAWQPRGNGALPGGPGADSGV